MGRGFAPVVTLLLAAACSAPSASATADPASDKLAQVQARGTLVGYAEQDYPPLSLAAEGAVRPPDTKCQPNQKAGVELTGFDNETTKLVAAALGVEACFVTPTWTEVTGGNWGDRWDIAYGSGSINADRMKRLYMTQAYYATPNHFYVREDSAFRTAEDLSGRRIGVCASCSHEYYLKGELEIPGVELTVEVIDPEIVAFETEIPGLQALAAGEIDAFLCAAPTGREQIEAGLPLRAIEKPAFTYYPTGFVDRSSGRDVVAFIGAVDAAVRAAQQDGRMVALSMEWFGTDYATGGAEFDMASIGQTIP